MPDKTKHNTDQQTVSFTVINRYKDKSVTQKFTISNTTNGSQLHYSEGWPLSALFYCNV